MKKFEGVLFCTDLDGTLVKGDKTISKKNIEAIEYFKSEGGKFTFVTGRMPYYAYDYYEKVKPNCPIGCANGGGIYDYENEKYLWTQTIDNEVLELVDMVYKNLPEIGIQVTRFDKIFFANENGAMAEFRRRTGVENVSCHYNDVQGPLAKILFGDLDEKNIDKLIEILDSHPKADKFDFIRSERILYEILPKGISKGNVVPKIVELLGLDSEKTIAIGDYNNDVSMIKSAKLGIAVANACQEALEAADHVTVSNEEDAIAKVIYDIESGALKI